jgi:glucose/arabinose dehydrogenase
MTQRKTESRPERPVATAGALALASAFFLLPGCGAALQAQADRFPTPQTPTREAGFIAVSAENATVRPERREVTPALVQQIRLPAGFRIDVFAEDLAQPRVVRVAPNGNVYVAEREEGRVRLLRDTNGDGRADVSRVVSSGLREDLRGVHGLAIHGERLYMVTETELLSAPMQANGDLGEVTVHIDDIPAGGQHPNRTIEFGPDGALYLSVGSTCNACVEPKNEHATLMRVNTRTWEREIFAEGLRNTIGFGWHPVSGRLYGLDHNSDGRGNDWPPEELNHVQQGRHYGWPFCGGDREVDWQLPEDPDGETRPAFCARTEPPVLTYQGHAAPMQMVYYTANAFPPEYRNDAFATMRGSWNRNPPVGYEVVRIRFDAGGTPIGVESFASGWLIEGGRAHFGRLMGLAQAADGSLLVTDDANGVVYRIWHQGS